MASLAEIQRLVQQIKDDLPLLINRSQIAPKQIVTVTGLSDISDRLGLVQAGEFRAGNGLEPGYGFTGIRIGYPAFAYGSDTWHVAGVNDDTLQVGISATTGKLFAGAGDVIIDGEGIWIENQQAAFGFEDTSGDRFTLYIYSGSEDELGLINMLPGKDIRFTVTLTDASTPYMKWREDPSNANVAKLEINAGQTATRVNIGGTNTAGITLWANSDGKETVFNDLAYDIDYRIEGDTNPNVFKLDAGLDKLTSLAWDGWTNMDHQTWTRTGNHTFTISGDVTAVYRKGTKVRYKDGGSFEYGVIGASSYSSPNTTVTLITNTDYTMAAATITDKSISHAESPEGWPHWFNFDPAPTGYSSVPSSPSYMWSAQGTMLYVLLNEDNDGTSNLTTKTYTLPVAVASNSPSLNWRAHIPLVRNNGVSESNGIYFAASGSTTLNARRENFATWTATGACRTIGATFIYQF